MSYRIIHYKRRVVIFVIRRISQVYCFVYNYNPLKICTRIYKFHEYNTHPQTHHTTNYIL